MSDNENVVCIVKHINPSFTDLQVEKFATDFLALESESFDFSENFNDETYRKNKLDKFHSLLAGLGFDKHNLQEAEKLLWLLYTDYCNFMFFIAECYQDIYPDMIIFKKISQSYYEDYMAEMASEYSDDL